MGVSILKQTGNLISKGQQPVSQHGNATFEGNLQKFLPKVYTENSPKILPRIIGTSVLNAQTTNSNNLPIVSSRLYEMQNKGLNTSQSIKVQEVQHDLFFPSNMHENKMSTPQSDLYVFIGLRGSGKSNAIQRIFNVSHKSLHADTTQFEIYELSNHGRNPNNIVLLECPGLKSFASPEENHAITSTLSNFLETHFVTPTFVFITARLNDNRFAGEYSEFSQALLTIKKVNRLASSTNWENLVVVFTFGDRPDVRNTDLMLKISKYEETVEAILGIKLSHKIVLHHEHLNSDAVDVTAMSKFKLVNNQPSANLSNIKLPNFKSGHLNVQKQECIEDVKKIDKMSLTDHAVQFLQDMTPTYIIDINA